MKRTYICEKYARLTEIMLSCPFFTIAIPTLLFISLKCFYYLSLYYLWCAFSLQNYECSCIGMCEDVRAMQV